MFTASERRATKPGRTAVVSSVVLHLALVAGVLVGSFVKGESEPIEYKVYKVDLYSPPPQQLGEPEAPKPQPAIVRPDPPKETAVKENRPAPKPQPKPKPVSTGTGKSDVAKGRNPDPKSLVGGEGIDVHMDGEEFPYPEYLNNIITQLNRYFRWNGAPNLETKVGFEIMRDGTVRRIKVIQKSGNINFDLEAVSAIEQAGKRGAFGPLPKGWVADRLPVAFSFLPPGR
jgi:outer membrane biosynthesis protein TonB